MKFSVLLAVYAKENPGFFNKSLESIFNQTILPDEVLIVKDGPLTSKLEDVILRYSSLYDVIRVLTLTENSGLGKALNFGLLQARNELVARMDSDDICYPERFQQQLIFMGNNPSISVVGAAIQEFDNMPGDLQRFRKLPSASVEIVKFGKFRNPLNHPTVMFRKSDVLSSGSYLDMPLFEDWYLWVRMLQKGFKLRNLDQPLLHFRVGNDMIGRRHGVSYLKKEMSFLNDIRGRGYLSTTEFVLNVGLKLPLRLIPKKALAYLYKSVLRKN